MIFLDISYYTFYRYYSIVRWYGFANKGEESSDDWSTNDKFMERYISSYWKPMLKFIKTNKLDNVPIIVAAD